MKRNFGSEERRFAHENIQIIKCVIKCRSWTWKWIDRMNQRTQIIITPKCKRTKKNVQTAKYQIYTMRRWTNIVQMRLQRNPKIDRNMNDSQNAKLDDKNKDRKKKIPWGILLLALSAYQLTAHYTHNTDSRFKQKWNKKKKRKKPSSIHENLFKCVANELSSFLILHSISFSYAIKRKNRQKVSNWETPTINFNSRKPNNRSPKTIFRTFNAVFSFVLGIANEYAHQKNSFGILNQR